MSLLCRIHLFPLLIVFVDCVLLVVCVPFQAKDDKDFYVYDDLLPKEPHFDSSTVHAGANSATMTSTEGAAMTSGWLQKEAIRTNMQYLGAGHRVTVVAAVYMRESQFGAPTALPIFQNDRGDGCWLSAGMLMLASMEQLWPLAKFGTSCGTPSCTK